MQSGVSQRAITRRPRTEALTMSDLDWKPDILGPGYSQAILDLGADPDGEGTIEAVLIRRDQQPGDTAPGAGQRGVVLYVPGFTDHFFRTQLPDFFAQQ